MLPDVNKRRAKDREARLSPVENHCFKVMLHQRYILSHGLLIEERHHREVWLATGKLQKHTLKNKKACKQGSWALKEM